MDHDLLHVLDSQALTANQSKFGRRMAKLHDAMLNNTEAFTHEEFTDEEFSWLSGIHDYNEARTLFGSVLVRAMQACTRHRTWPELYNKAWFVREMKQVFRSFDRKMNEADAEDDAELAYYTAPQEASSGSSRLKLVGRRQTV